MSTGGCHRSYAMGTVRSRQVIPVFYLDTSVFGGYFDEEFQEATRAFWTELFEGRCRVMLSTLSLEELAPAPEEVLST